MLSIARNSKYFKVIEYIFFVVFWGLSIYFMYGVLEKFFAVKTTISQSEEHIKELPSITFCFMIPNIRITEYVFGLDFIIQYEILDSKWNKSSIFLTEGENATIIGETISLEKIIAYWEGNCYKLTSILTSKYMIKQRTQIILYFNDSITEEDLPTTLKIFVTSEKNSYGVVQNDWRDGKIFKTEIIKGMNRFYELKPIRHKNSKCSHESYYDCMSRVIAENLKESSSTCSMFSLPSLNVCKINKTNYETEQFWTIFNNVHDQCSIKMCITLEYNGGELYYGKSSRKNVKFFNFQFLFGYTIPSNSTALYEEYQIYDAITTIGSVGGTLGMCIGFSFTGLISSLINALHHICHQYKT